MVFPVILIYTSLIWIARCDGSVVNSSAGGSSCSSSSLHEAVVNSDIGSLKEAVRNGVDLYSKDCSGLTGMELALLLENERAIHVLLEGSFDLDATDEEGSTLLCTAARRGNKFLLHKLREYGSTVDVVNANGSTPLFEALVSGREDVTEALLKAGAKLNFKLPGGNSYLHRAVELADFRIALNLLNFKASMDPVYAKDDTPLSNAALMDTKPYFNLLFSKGADASRRNKLLKLRDPFDQANAEDHTPLSKAVLMDNKPFVNLLVSRGADVSRRNKLGETYLHLAAKGNGIKVCTALVRYGINVDAENNEGETALFYAVKQNNTEIARALIESGAELNKSNGKGETYLHLAAKGMNILPVFLTKGINVDAENNAGETPLFYAAKQNNTEVARALIESGANLNRINKNGESYLHMSRNNRTQMEKFLELGVEPDVENSKGTIIMREAVVTDDTETMELLYKYGSDVNQTVMVNLQYGREIVNATLLHLAARVDSPKAVEWLVSHGAVINMRSGSYTPLDIAAMERNDQTARKLIELGACDNYWASGCEHSSQLYYEMDRTDIAETIRLKEP